MVSSLGILAASYQTVGWGGALIATGVNVFVYGLILELKNGDSRLSRILFSLTPEWIAKRKSFGWFFFVTGLLLTTFGLVASGLGLLDIHAIRRPIAQDHDTFLDTQRIVRAESRATGLPTIREEVRREEERLIRDITRGVHARSVLTEDDETDVVTFLVRSVELNASYLPFDLEMSTASPNVFVSAMAVMLGDKDGGTGAYRSIRRLKSQLQQTGNAQGLNRVRIKVDQPTKNSQVGLVVSIKRVKGDKVQSELDRIFFSTRYLIREASP